MKIVYIAGPFRADTAWGIECNIRKAEAWGAIVMKHGAMPLIYHANCRYYTGLMDDSFFLSGTLELMYRCDAVLMVPNWSESSGATEERRQAIARNIPVFDMNTDGQWEYFCNWLKRSECEINNAYEPEGKYKDFCSWLVETTGPDGWCETVGRGVPNRGDK